MSPNDFAFFMGTVVLLIGAIIFIVFYATENFNPVERRARRFAVLAAAMSAAAVIGSVVAIYLFVNKVAGSFLAMPSIGIAGVAVWHATWMTYMQLGGGQEKKNGSLSNA